MIKDKPIEITIDGKKTVYSPRNFDILKLKYYSENPRVNYILTQYEKTPSQEEIRKALWKLESTKDLYRDILENKGIIEPIIVKDDFVLEGNSRLCACRKLYDDAKDETEKEHWRCIPGILLPSEVTDRQILQLLGVYHVRGRAPWRTFEKASYVYRMRYGFSMKEEEIAKNIGITIADVEQMIESYTTMKKEKVEDMEKISYFIEFYKNRDLKKMRQEHPNLVKEFATWVKEERIPRAEEVRDLPKILKDKRARQLFKSGGDFRASRDVAFSRHPEHESVFLRHLKNITIELKRAQIPRLLVEIRDQSKMDIVKEFIKEVKRFEEHLKIK